ncbi:MAG: DUF4231 domain-containing protein [Acidobacteriaceae bacterium]|nr:DUF4231 domain-containing protein [Acidobacteriaceae bacterium]
MADTAAPGVESALASAPGDVTLQRLENQITWYNEKSALNQRRYKTLKAATIVSAAIIPVLTTASAPYGARIVAGLGVLIAIIEGLQQLNQYQTNWTSFRSTAEALKHEKYLYLAKAGSYSDPATAHSTLAERVESLVSQENAKWFIARSELPKGGSARG